jgi:hypothetical protein
MQRQSSYEALSNVLNLAYYGREIRLMRIERGANPETYSVVHDDVWKVIEEMNVGRRIAYTYQHGAGSFPDLENGAPPAWTWRIDFGRAARDAEQIAVPLVEFAVAPKFVYGMAFAHRRAGADGNPHPIRAFRLQRGYFDTILDSIFAALNLKALPASRPFNEFEKRAVRGDAPIRCIPSTIGNAPIAFTTCNGSEEWVSAVLLKNADGGWRQLVRNGAQYWINDAMLVKL